MLTYSQFNRRITGQVSCCIGATGAQGAKGPQGATGAQGAKGAIGTKGTQGATGAVPWRAIDGTPDCDAIGAQPFTLASGFIVSNQYPGTGYSLMKDACFNYYTIPFGGDMSNNLPSDNEGNLIQLNSSSWLKIVLDPTQIDIPPGATDSSGIFYIPIYWKKT